MSLRVTAVIIAVLAVTIGWLVTSRSEAHGAGALASSAKDTFAPSSAWNTVRRQTERTWTPARPIFSDRYNL